MEEISNNAELEAKREKYRLLTEQISALIDGETDCVSVMANVCSAIHYAMGFFWTGFYRVNNGELLLGPFQGPVYVAQHGKNNEQSLFQMLSSFQDT